MGFSEDDLVLECIMLVGTIALDPEAAPLLAASKLLQVCCGYGARSEPKQIQRNGCGTSRPMVGGQRPWAVFILLHGERHYQNPSSYPLSFRPLGTLVSAAA